MQIISHRGCWTIPEEKNSLKSLYNSVKSGFGCETDIRDFDSSLVISHDISNKSNISFNSVLNLFKNNDLLLAINIKADGLQDLLHIALDNYNISNYFVFDMSVPDTKGYINMGLNVFCRQSEYEPFIPFYKDIKGIWLDAFEQIWYTSEIINNHLINGKKVCIVSAELHKRDHLEHWNFIKSFDFIADNNLILCTDYPQEAIEFFGNLQN